MNDDELKASDMFLLRTSADGLASLRAHRVWNRMAFLAARQAECDAENREAREKSPNAPALAAVESVSAEEYAALQNIQPYHATSAAVFAERLAQLRAEKK